MSDIGVTLAIVGWVGAAISMLVHLIGVLAGWWAVSGPTWTVAFLFLLLHAVGFMIDDRWN